MVVTGRAALLALLGVVDRFKAIGKSGTCVNVYANHRRLVQFSFEGLGRQVGQGAFEPQPIILPQSETERLLGEFLEELDGQVEWNTSFLSYHQTGDKVVAEVHRSDGTLESIEADYLVSCEGARSIIRKGRKGFFLGCSGYPKCKNTGEVPAKLLEEMGLNANGEAAKAGKIEPPIPLDHEDAA